MEYTESFFAERGKHHYTLSEDTLSITGSSSNVTVQLKGLEPEYQTVRRRSPGFYVGLIGAVLALVLGLFAKAGLAIADLIKYPFAAAVIMAVISLLCLFTSWRKVEFAIFKSTMGLDAISIARSGPDSLTFDRFVDELSRRIRQVKEADGEGANNRVNRSGESDGIEMN